MIFVAENILINLGSAFIRKLNIDLNFKYGFYQSMPCTRKLNGGYGENLLVFSMLSSQISIFNQSTNVNGTNSDLYTIPCVFFIPKDLRKI